MASSKIIEVPGHKRPFWVVQDAFGGRYYQGEYKTREAAEARLAKMVEYDQWQTAEHAGASQDHPGE